MLYFNDNKANCTGCSACYSVCPIQCITMYRDEEGFLYPVASDKCVKCGKCKIVCPMQKSTYNHSDFEKKAFCALSKSKSIWTRSTSGGAFSEICNAFGDENTIICGAAWDNLSVKHICIKGVNNISSLCKSKYIASSLDNVFKEIKKYLENGIKVIFCGTPCQVDGLRNMLGKSYDNLLLIDLICHGVGSSAVFHECIFKMQKQFSQNITKFGFREKRNCYETDYLSKITFEDGSGKYLINDQYIQLFLKQNCLRPSCGKNCHYRTENRVGDITIADFKGLTEVFPELLGTKKNYSSIIVNSEKAYKLIDRLKKQMIMFECDLENIKKFNPLFHRQTWFSDDRNAFFEDFTKNPSEAIEKWTIPATLSIVSHKKSLYNFLPIFIRRILIKIKKRKHLM